MRTKCFFRVVYFKPSGKFYVSDKFQLEVAMCGPKQEVPYMQDAVDYLVDLRTAGQKMPGLSGIWRGPVFVDHEDGFPCLIPGLPDE